MAAEFVNHPKNILYGQWELKLRKLKKKLLRGEELSEKEQHHLNRMKVWGRMLHAKSASKKEKIELADMQDQFVEARRTNEP